MTPSDDAVRAATKLVDDLLLAQFDSVLNIGRQGAADKLCERKQQVVAALAAHQSAAPSADAVRAECRKCNGSGTISTMTSHLGPDDYEFEESCPSCCGTGSADLRDAVNALGYWKLKMDVERVVVARSDVLRILDAHAALAAHRSNAAAQERPQGNPSAAGFKHPRQRPPDPPVAAAPDERRMVPLAFLQGVLTLAHNYSLAAIPPDYYSGMAADAFKDAYRRCGKDLAALRAMLAASPTPPEAP
jgi:hypothetical protein